MSNVDNGGCIHLKPRSGIRGNVPVVVESNTLKCSMWDLRSEPRL